MPLYPQERSPLYPLERSLLGPNLVKKKASAFARNWMQVPSIPYGQWESHEMKIQVRHEILMATEHQEIFLCYQPSEFGAQIKRSREFLCIHYWAMWCYSLMTQAEKVSDTVDLHSELMQAVTWADFIMRIQIPKAKFPRWIDGAWLMERQRSEDIQSRGDLLN